MQLENDLWGLNEEKYKKYNPRFQVGADIILFNSSKKRAGPYVEREMKEKQENVVERIVSCIYNGAMRKKMDSKLLQEENYDEV